MAGDIGIRERAVILPASASFSAAPPVQADGRRRVVHVYGSRVMVMEEPLDGEAMSFDAGAVATGGSDVEPDLRASLAPDELMGLDALGLRHSPAYMAAKAARPYDGANWDSGAAGAPACTAITRADSGSVSFAAGAPTSSRLTGSVAVGIIMVEGPDANLKFSDDERVKVVAEVQNGLGWLATQSPEGITFKYDIQVVALTTKPGVTSLSADAKEARWRDPVMEKLGFSSGLDGVTAYVESLRTRLGTTWAYCAYFTKYPLGWFAYASIGGPRLVMDYANDGWGPDNIDRVFAHETGHIFGCPDEYGGSGCTCGGSWGIYGKPNGNCENCAPGGGVDCLMKANSWAMCSYTPYHLGFPMADQTYTGVWRQGSDAYYLWVNATWSSFQSKWQELAAKNLRLVDLKITRQGNEDKFHGIWREGSGGYYLWVNADWNSFSAKWDELARQNLRLVSMEVKSVNGVLLYSGVWLPGSDGYYLWVNADWNSFKAKWDELAKQNLRLIGLKIIPIRGNQQRYFGVWREGRGGHYLWADADWDSFIAKWTELAGQNLRLVDLETRDTSSGRRYSGVWLEGSDAYYLWAGADWQSFRAKWEELAAQNLRLIDLDVIPITGTQSQLRTGTAESGGMAMSFAGQETEDGMGGGSEDAALRSNEGTGFGGGSTDRRDSTVASNTNAGRGGGSLPAIPVQTAAISGYGGGDVQGTGTAKEDTSSAGMGGGSVG